MIELDLQKRFWLSLSGYGIVGIPVTVWLAFTGPVWIAIVFALFWFYPFIWMAAGQEQRDREKEKRERQST